MPVWTWPNKPVCVAILPGRNVWPSGQTTFYGWGKKKFLVFKRKMRCIFKGCQVPLFGFFSNEVIYWMLYNQCWFNSEFVLSSLKKEENVKSSLLVLPDPKYDGLITSSTASSDNCSANRPESVKLGSLRSWSSYSEQAGRNKIKKRGFLKAHFIYELTEVLS